MKRRTPLAPLPLLVTALACSDVPDGPASIAYPDAEAPVIAEGLTFHPTPAESLLVRALDPAVDRRPAPLALVFHRGRGVARDGAGRAYVPDPRGSRVLVIGHDLRVEGVVGGPSEAGGGLSQPLSVAPVRDDELFVVDADADPGLFYFDSGSLRGSARPPGPYLEVRADGSGVLWAARSPYILRSDSVESAAPLLYRFDPLRGTGVGVAEIEPVASAGWNRVANAGSVAAGPDGTGYFAFFLRNELRAYTPAGDLSWRVSRALSFETFEPEFAGEGEDLGYRVQPVTQALALGPDGLLYALTVPDSLPGIDMPGSTSGSRRIEAYDPTDGRLVRASTVPAAWNTFAVDEEGRVYRVDPDALEREAPPVERPRLPGVILSTFDGDSATFSDYRGKALLVNFWASWCAPCRAELPQLARYYPTLDSSRVEFLAISVDDTPEEGRSFIRSFELPFPTLYGGMRMQERFGFIGLPYTLVADARGRIVEEVYGFGSPESWKRIQEALEREMARIGADRPAGHGGGMHGGHGDAGSDPR